MLDNGANSFPAEDVGLLRIAFFFFFFKAFEGQVCSVKMKSVKASKAVIISD